MSFEKIFKIPGREYRCIPFWSWNDKLEPEELRRQINEMDAVGMGGYFMHARPGLKTEYFSEDWMNCIEASISEGKKLGMNSWLYDEFGWPSGFAGGIVTSKGEKYQQKWLECKELDNDEETEAEGKTLGFFVLEEGLKYKRVNSLEEAKAFIGKNKVVRIFYHINPYYADLLDKEVVKVFIDCTYELYYEKFKEYFGREVPGIFTDEPQYHRRCTPWSYILEGEFRSRYEYELTDNLPCLFYELKGYEKVRYDFWKTVSDLYTTSYIKQIAKWCENHNCSLTGHVMYEDSLPLQMSATAGAMPAYEYMQVPGIDWLWRWIGDPITPKQVSSVAHQLGKKFVISEMFGGSGWNVSFEELKWIAEWQYVLGINLMCQHLENYSLKGARKRDFPPMLFYQQSWWKEYKLFNDYFARLGVALTEGNHKADVLVIHPIRSAWIAYNNLDKQAATDLNDKFKNISAYLLNMHIDFDYGDEGIISNYGKTGEGKFIVGNCEYGIVVLPSLISLESTTIKLLDEFIQKGGRVIAAGELPQLCEGQKDEKLQQLNSKMILVDSNKEAIKNGITRYLKPSITICDKEGSDLGDIYCQERDAEGRKIVFLVNTNKDKGFEAVVNIDCKGRVYQLILETGDTVEPANVKNTQNGTELKLSFEPAQSYLIVIDKNRKNEEIPESEYCPADREISLDGQWKVTMEDYNSLTLDYCRISIDGGPWSDWKPVIQAQEELILLDKKVNVNIMYKFNVDMDLSTNKEMYIIVEEPEKFNDIHINDNPVEYRDSGWWRDIAFKKIDVRPYVKNGENYVTMSREFYCNKKARDIFIVALGPRRPEANTEVNKIVYDVELESIYVAGDFGVNSLSAYQGGLRKTQITQGPFIISQASEKAAVENSLVEQGMPFFSGSVKLEQNVDLGDIAENDKVYLKFDSQNAVMSKINVNGREAKALYWRPFEADISGFVKAGVNKISIELFNSCRNLLGPHHHVVGEKYSVRPDNFTKRRSVMERETQEEDVWRDTYCFVQFGVCSPVSIKVHKSASGRQEVKK